MTMSGHDLLWEINWKEKKRKEKRSPEPDDPQEPQMCIHSLYLLLWKQPHSNMNTPPSLLLAAFLFSLLFFSTLYQWLEYLCGFLPSTVASSWQAAVTGMAEMVQNLLSFPGEKPQPPKPR